MGDTNTIHVLGATDFVLEDSDITNDWRGRSCVLIGYGQSDLAVRPVIRRNRFHECGSLANGSQDHAIYAANLVDGVIADNVFWNTSAYAIHLYPNAQRTHVSHNVIDNGAPSVAGGLIIGSNAEGIPSSGNIIEYNVIAYSSYYNIRTTWGGAIGTGNVVRANCVFGGGQGNISTDTALDATGNLVADPLFVSMTSRDYRLRSDSPCLGTSGYDVAARLG